MWLLGGGSGHGFKHGPAMAERLAAALRGESRCPGTSGSAGAVASDAFRTAGADRGPAPA